VRRASYLLGIDIGGTFTDVVLMNSDTGEQHLAKVPSTPGDQSVGFAQGIAQLLDDKAIAPQTIDSIYHGTTVATNLILEGKGAAVALITNQGFRHVLEIGRHDIPRKANMFSWIKPPRPVHPANIHEIAGRLNVDGTEHEALNDHEIDALGRTLAVSGCHTIAICLLHSYANPAHERHVRERLLEAIPNAQISISSDILPVFREYERSMATILNVYVLPEVVRYVSRLEKRIGEIGVQAPILLMKSSGGVTGTATIRREPIQTVLSGPAAGVIGATRTAVLAGYPDFISIDIGGTSADVCLVKGGEHAVTARGRIGDWPLQTPMIDITTIGAGGGSIARVTENGELIVGPHSAGSNPGPVCYGKGGVQPTVTDANLVLGRLCPTLLDDSFALDLDGAKEAIRKRIAEPLGLSVDRAAQGILDIVDHAMVGAIRLVSVERGLDPRNFALLPFGGAGPVHGGSLARLLGMKTQIVPAHPGVLSAFGLLTANLRNDFSRTCVELPPDYKLDRIAQVFSELEEQARAWLMDERVPRSRQLLQWTASLRYAHQGFELAVPWTRRTVNKGALSDTIERFHELHRSLYTFSQPETPVQLVTLHVTATAKLERPSPPNLIRRSTKAPRPSGQQRMVVAGRVYRTPIYRRDALTIGAPVDGPAVIKQMDTTTVVLPGQRASVRPSGALLIVEK
jgi:N-methylhydantoinase A